ncbi:MAG: exodeoxyribonuclease V subunit alpha [Pseudomonadota bacterium]
MYKEIFSDLDIHFARLMTRLAADHSTEVFLAAALASSHTRQGHICADLTRLAGANIDGFVKGPISEDKISEMVFPELNHWLIRLKQCSVIGEPGEYKPLILDNKARIYLYRYWEYQDICAKEILCRTKGLMDMNSTLLKDGLKRLFPACEPGVTDWQKVAACSALTKGFCVISGGPGTGKTTTVSKILALLIEQAYPQKPRIALCAPTGKAAFRLQEAIVSSKKDMDCLPHINKNAIPEKGSTIHRLLGVVSGSPYFRHNRKNPLPFDVIIIDEASMMDLAMTAKLFQALSANVRLILLGDKDQLASVEAGAVLGDICDARHVDSFSTPFISTVKALTGCDLPYTSTPKKSSNISDSIIELKHNYRFSGSSEISAISAAVKLGDGESALKVLKQKKPLDISWLRIPSQSNISSSIKKSTMGWLHDYIACFNAREAFELFDRFRILCALRKGPYGVTSINKIIEDILSGERLILKGALWYKGRPIVITKNDYQSGLFNGDVGITLPDPNAKNELKVFFRSEDGGIKGFPPLSLPEHETVFAMTVHKSQGSEFERALVLLPEKDAMVLTRELIYTAITRAKKHVEIWGDEAVFKTAAARSIERASGLRDLLTD